MKCPKKYQVFVFVSTKMTEGLLYWGVCHIKNIKVSTEFFCCSRMNHSEQTEGRTKQGWYWYARKRRKVVHKEDANSSFVSFLLLSLLSSICWHFGTSSMIISSSSYIYIFELSWVQLLLVVQYQSSTRSLQKASTNSINSEPNDIQVNASVRATIAMAPSKN